MEAGLTKQREELAEVLGSYISLITKLLQDKEELTNALREKEQEVRERELEMSRELSRENEYGNRMETLREANLKLKHALDERDEQIRIDNKKLDEFLQVIHQFEEDDHKEQKRMETMMTRIQELESKSKSKEQLLSTSTIEKREAQDAKVQTLIELLESTQRENERLNE